MKNPLQLKFPFALWTCDMLVDLIIGISLSRSSVSRLLKQLGLSPQRPLRRAYQQNPEAVEQWLKEDFSHIRKEAQKVGATIYFADEAGVRSDYHSGTTWGVRGQTPAVSGTAARFGLNVISVVNRQGKLRFMVFNGRLNGDLFIQFLRRLLYGASQPIFLIVDGHPAHKSAKVGEFADPTEGKLRLFYLPTYLQQAGVFTRTQSRRTSLEPPEEPRDWQAVHNFTGTDDQSGSLPLAIDTKKARLDTVFFPLTNDSVCRLI